MRGPRPGVQGKNGPNWKGGISSLPYCFEFTPKLREETREDFGYTCFWCGILQEEYLAEQRARGKQPCKLHVHHIDYNKNQGCDEVKWKLILLCGRCHGKINKNPEEMEKFFIEKLYFREFSMMCQSSTVLFE